MNRNRTLSRVRSIDLTYDDDHIRYPGPGVDQQQEHGLANGSAAPVTPAKVVLIELEHAEVQEVVSEGHHDGVLQSGWLLKKGKKKLQGYARRHFSLSSTGNLTYRLSPGQPARGERHIKGVSVAASGKTRAITIDGGAPGVGGNTEGEIWHLRALSSEEWVMWMTAIRKFIMDPEVRSMRSAMRSPRVGGSVSPQMGSGSLRSGVGTSPTSLGQAAGRMQLNGVEPAGGKIVGVLEDMSRTMTDMEHILAAVEEGGSSSLSPSRKASFGLKSKKEKGAKEGHHGGHSQEGGKEKDGFFGLFHRRSSHNVSTSPPPSTDIPPLSHSSRASPSPSLSPSSSSAVTHPHSSSTPHISPLHAALSGTLTALRAQHTQLTLLVAQQQAARPPSRPSTIHESDASLHHQHSHPHPLQQEVARRTSMLTVGSAATSREETGDLEWFDADDWDVEEIELDVVDVGESEEAGDEEEEEEEEEEEVEVGLGVEEAEKAEAEVDREMERVELEREMEAGETERRRQRLPAMMTGEEGSLWAVLRKNVGKDLSTISFPVTFNEPLSLLQKLAEEMEYSDLLSRATASADPVERLCLVSAFAVSTYASTHYRAARKPFNPLLGETFEDVRPHYRFLAEKVQHHPPVMATFAEGQGWAMWATTGGKNKFWGRSLEIIPVGTTHLKIGESHYQWQKPSSFMRNIMAGQKYLEHVGPMIIEDTASGYRCELEFKDSGFWGTTRNSVIGSVRSFDGRTLASVEGTWHESFHRRMDDAGDTLSVLWRANAMPPHAEQYYGFTYFALQLNEILPSMTGRLPPTDSRLRPDQRAMEEGRVDEADGEKVRLEVAQRARRKSREEQGKAWEPAWFRKVEGTRPGALGDGVEWEYKGGYWEAKERAEWVDPGLFV